MASFTGSRSLYVGPDGENDLKPMGMVELIEKEVGLDLYGVKPKEAIKLTRRARCRASTTSST